MSLTCDQAFHTRSLNSIGYHEAQKHKWIASQRAGRDLGEEAIRQWIREHWNGLVRHHWLEHINGTTFWIELRLCDYGVLANQFVGEPLLAPILDHLKCGKEQLDILKWAHDTCQCIPNVLEILDTLDVNSSRLQAQFAPKPQ